jgi:hypothetical protein
MRNLEGNDIVFGDKVLSGFGADEYNLRDFISTSSEKNYPYWDYCWQSITVANKMLNYLDDETVGDNKLLQKYKGMGLVTRAYFYAYLMENYQDAYLQGGKDKLGVMLYDTYNPSSDYQARATSEDTYKFIKNDISNAISLLKNAGVDFTSDIYDLDLGVAYFVQARVALWTGDYQECINAATQILSKYPNLMTESVYGSRIKYTDGVLDVRPEDNAFTNNAVNSEVLFGWDSSKDKHIHQSWMNCFSESFNSTSGYGCVSGGFARIDNRLYDKIADDDYRKDCFMKEAFGDYKYPNKDAKYIPAYTNLKFAANYGLGSNNMADAGISSFCNFRTSEVLLMKAEAQAMSGDESGAKSTLNKLLAARTRSGATTLTVDNYPSMIGMTTIQKIQLQWRIEMWGENGREFYNNKRWGIAVDRSDSQNHVVKGSYAVKDMTLKIPENEMLYNSYCVQN